jgi:hypothetical protein
MMSVLFSLTCLQAPTEKITKQNKKQDAQAQRG